jgi:plasmid stability protein
MNINFLFRFPDDNTKRDFRVEAAKLNKSMNELLGDLVIQYLNREEKRAS